MDLQLNKVTKMTEQFINEFLIKAIKAYKAEMKLGHNEIAKWVLVTASQQADFWLDFYGFRKNYSAIKCQCGQVLKTAQEQEFYKNVGECFSCDHIRSDNYYEN